MKKATLVIAITALLISFIALIFGRNTEEHITKTELKTELAALLAEIKTLDTNVDAFILAAKLEKQYGVNIITYPFEIWSNQALQNIEKILALLPDEVWEQIKYRRDNSSPLQIVLNYDPGALGRYYPSLHLITLSAVFMDSANSLPMLESTLLHELGHAYLATHPNKTLMISEYTKTLDKEYRKKDPEESFAEDFYYFMRDRREKISTLEIIYPASYQFFKKYF